MATPVMGLVMERMRKIVSSAIGGPPRDWLPKMLKATTLPSLMSAYSRPATSSLSTACFMRASRAARPSAVKAVWAETTLDLVGHAACAGDAPSMAAQAASTVARPAASQIFPVVMIFSRVAVWRIGVSSL